MSKKVVLILGASGGIGKALTQEFIKDASIQLALHYHTNQINTPEGDALKKYQANLCVENEVQSLINKVKQDFGRIDSVINGAGVSLSGMSWKTDADQWQQTLNVNLTAPFLVTKFVLPIMRAQNFGRIIYMSSIVAQTGVRTLWPYKNNCQGGRQQKHYC